jgi:uncharacterized protein YcfL
MGIFKTYFLLVFLLLFFNGCTTFDSNETKPLIKHQVIILEENKLALKNIDADTSYLEYLYKQYDLVDIKP